MTPGLNTLQPAVFAASPNDTLVLASGGIYTLTLVGGSVLVNKALTIQGADNTALVITTDDSLNTMFSIASSNVTITNFTAKHDGQTGSADTVFAVTALDLTNIVFSDLIIQYTEIGISSRKSTLTIQDNFFESISGPSNDHRAIILDGTTGSTLVKDNTFNSNTGGTKGTFFLLVTSNAGVRTISGNLTLEGNTLLPGEDPLKQFFVMESFNGPIGGFVLTANGNEFSANRGSFIFFSTIDKPANIFSSVVMTNNIDSSDPSSGYKGLLGFDGIPGLPKFDVATDPESIFSFSGNSLAVNAITADPWDPIAPGGVLGVDTEVYNVSFFVPAPDPSTTKVQQIEERFPTQGDIINILTWRNPIIGIDSFNIYRDSPFNLIANVPAQPISNFFLDHQRQEDESVTYFLQSVFNGITSGLTPITFP